MCIDTNILSFFLHHNFLMNKFVLAKLEKK